jgi:response regulator RpfG family c-di-GMP phosphodiesterase
MSTPAPESARARVLYVDDEENVLLAVKRHQRKSFDLHTCSVAQEALDRIRSGEAFAVVVSDLRMPRMDGVEFLKAVQGLMPDATRIMVTGNADLDSAKRAVNDGHVYRFLTKPCEPELLREAIHSGVRIYELVVAERDLLERTLRGAVEVLTQTLSLSNPEAFGRAARIRRYVTALVSRLALENPWQYEVAAMLSQLGAITVPPDVTRKAYRGQPLSIEEGRMLAQSPVVASRLLRAIPRLEGVAEMVRLQSAQFRGGSEEPPLGARILRVALDFDALVLRGTSSIDAVKALRQAAEGTYDPALLSAADELMPTDGSREERTIALRDLRVGMIVADPLTTEEGLLVVAAGQEVSESLLERLHNWTRSSLHRVREPIRVLVTKPNS